jgi:hypothetical protein
MRKKLIKGNHSCTTGVRDITSNRENSPAPTRETRLSINQAVVVRLTVSLLIGKSYRVVGIDSF